MNQKRTFRMLFCEEQQKHVYYMYCKRKCPYYRGMEVGWITCAYDPENPLYPNAIVKEYRIGNILRGYIKFKARNDHEAWNRGRALMEEAIPSEGQLGRAMQLDVWQTIKTTAKMEDIEGAWFPVLIGQTKEPWPK